MRCSPSGHGFARIWRPCGSCLLVAVLAASAGPSLDGTTVPRTLRVDYEHIGDAAAERFVLDRVVREGPWPGPADRLLDDTGLGKYLFEVVDPSTGSLLYTRGFASIFGEWETTGEARTRSRTFHESVRFPEPAAPVRLVLKKRVQATTFEPLWSVEVDPSGPDVRASVSPPSGKVWAVQENGPPAEKVDLLLIGDGYTVSQMDEWHADASRLTEALFAVSPFREQRHRFNVWAIDAPSDESGITDPSRRIERRTAVGASYGALGTDRYVLTFENARLRETAAAAPYEFVHIVANESRYGGGGIHNLYATAVADHALSAYVFVHEFGHHFAGLADEYYTSPVAYAPARGRPEPWEPNVTADPTASKWRDLVPPGVPLPTPWAKAEFEAQQRALLARRGAAATPGDSGPDARPPAAELLGRGPHADAVGAFEGAMYEASGYYRPQTDCLMFSRVEGGFCAVCRRAIERVIDLYAPDTARR
jgi:hypothetical protein